MFTKNDLKKLIIPLIIEQFLAISLGMIDTVMVSSVGEAAISGVSLVDMINVLVIDIFAGLATGGAVVATHYLGARDSKGASKTAANLVFISLTAGCTAAVTVFFCGEGILMLLYGKSEADVLKNALVYLKITSLSFPFISVYNSCAALFRSMGDSRMSMMSSLFINILNLAGNTLFIFVFNLGVSGAAWSTVISRFAAMIYLLIRLSTGRGDIKLSFKTKPDIRMTARILRIAAPSGIENSMFQLGRVIVVTLIATFGTAQIAANALANNLDAIGCIPGKGLQLAMVTVVGQCIGAGLNDEAVSYTKRLMKSAHIMMAVINTAVILTMPLSLKLYNVSYEAKALGALLVLIHAGCAIFLWPESFVLPNALRSGGDVRFTLIVSIFSMWMFRIVFSYILARGAMLGALGVWCAMIMDWVFRTVMFITRFKSRKWIRGTLAE